MTFLESGCGERAKATCHGLGCALFGGFALFNAAAYAQRRESHLLANAIGYALVAYYEYISVRHHLECERSDAS